MQPTRSSPEVGADVRQENDTAEKINIELIKSVLDFASKAFYPILIVVLIFLLKPAFDKIDLRQLVERLQVAKVGSSQLSFFQAKEDMAADTAPLNHKVKFLEKLVEGLQAEFDSMPKDAGSKSKNEEETNRRKEELNQFQEYSKYSALVFHRKSSRARGELVVNALLKDGFKSSDTETTFAELMTVEPEDGVIYLTYTQEGKPVLDQIREILENLNDRDFEIKIHPNTISLRRGDVQVYVF